MESCTVSTVVYPPSSVRADAGDGLYGICDVNDLDAVVIIGDH